MTLKLNIKLYISIIEKFIHTDIAEWILDYRKI